MARHRGTRGLLRRAAVAAACAAQASAGPVNSTARGTGYDFRDPRVVAKLEQLPLRWWYNWGATGGASPDALNYSSSHGIEFVPMIYGCGKSGPECSDLYPNGSLQNVPLGARALLGFNEPNHKEESNMEPAQAASLWPELEQLAEQRGLRLGSPSPAPCGDAFTCITQDPFQWWAEFNGNCSRLHGRPCRVDFMATHLYTCSPQHLQWYINDLDALFHKPVWITEFACPNPNGTLAAQARFMQSALKLLENDTRVERYAWFAPNCTGYGWLGPTCSLFGGNAGSPGLDLLGKLYEAGGTDAAMAALMDSLPPEERRALAEQQAPGVQAEGSWAAHCAACAAGGGPSRGAAAAAQCYECGFVDYDTSSPFGHSLSRRRRRLSSP